MSDNNNNKKPERPNPFGSYPYPITNASRTGNNNQPPPLTEKMIDGYKKILSAKIGFIFLKEKMKFERTDGGEDAVAKIDEFTEELKDKYIKKWDENVKGKREFMTNGRLDPKLIEATVTASAFALVASIQKGGRRRRRKKRTKKRRKSRRKSRRRKRRRKKRTKRRR